MNENRNSQEKRIYRKMYVKEKDRVIVYRRIILLLLVAGFLLVATTATALVAQGKENGINREEQRKEEAYEKSDFAYENRQKIVRNANETHKTVEFISAEPDPEELADREEMGELELLACCTYAEAGNQGYEGMRKVAAVILNRVNSEAFPDTITEVILQKNQFEVVSNGRIYELGPTDECYDAVRDELLERSDTDILFFRTGRYPDYGTPAYKCGDHYFSY